MTGLDFLSFPRLVGALRSRGARPSENPPEESLLCTCSYRMYHCHEQGAHVTRCITYFQQSRLRDGSGVHVPRRQGFIDQSVLGWSLSYTTASAALLFREGLPLFHLHSRLLSLALFPWSIYGSEGFPRPSSMPPPLSIKTTRHALTVYPFVNLSANFHGQSGWLKESVRMAF